MKILIIDDDVTFHTTLQRRLQQAGNYEVDVFSSVAEALCQPADNVLAILLDMQLENASGLDGIVPLKAHYHPQHLIMLTGYASIATTVEAMKRGATDYLAKPAGLKEILIRLDGAAELPEDALRPMTPAQIEREHIQRILAEHNGNISATAEALGMHRRTLQRKLQKYVRGA